jgi:hypothetical protein
VRTFPNINLSVFPPEQRPQIKIFADMMRQVSGGLARSILGGQSPAANPVPTLSNPTGPPPQGGTPVAAQGDLLYGLSGGAWAKLPIGSANQFLVVSSGLPAWSNTLGGTLNVVDASFFIQDDADPTKKVQFQCSGITPLTTRTITVPDLDATMAVMPASPTAGAVIFVGGGRLAQDAANLFWDDTNNVLAIGHAVPVIALDIIGSTDARSTIAVSRSGGKFGAMLAGSSGMLISYDATGRFFFSPAAAKTSTGVDGPKCMTMFGSTGNTAFGTITEPNIKLLVMNNNAANPVLRVTGANIQTGDLQQWTNSVPTVLSYMTSAGIYRGAAATFKHAWKANGPYIVDTDVDGGVAVPTAMTIDAIWVYRTTAGGSSSTIVDIHKNGTTIYTTQANRPTIVFNDADKKVQATLPDVTAVAAGDILTLDIDQAETGTPADLTVVIQGI